MQLRARYDAAQTTVENARHWAHADGLSAAQANHAGVRYILRNRSRYEFANNSYFAGLAANLAGDTVGTGPTLQLQTDDEPGNQRTEQAWQQWAEEIQLAEKLRLARSARLVDGAVFGVFHTDRGLASPVQLNLSMLPDEMVTRHRFQVRDWADGIEYDIHGRPLRYHIASHHPSEQQPDPKPIDARHVIHYAHLTRPGQLRGIPESTPALPLYAQLRRFTLATLDAAETAAHFAVILTTAASDQGEDSPTAPLTTFEIFRRMMVTAPRGYGFNQLKAEHPTTNHQMFLGCILQEIAACHQVPLYLVAGTAADLSYAGGRLDLQSYERTIRTERHRMACQILNACWLRWLEEAVFVPGLLPRTRSPYGDWRKQWFWPPFEHVDPLKEANAQKIRLANNTTTLADEWAKQNADWEVKMRQRAKEKALARELGVEEAAMLPGNQPQQGPANVFQPA